MGWVHTVVRFEGKEDGFPTFDHFDEHGTIWYTSGGQGWLDSACRYVNEKEVEKLGLTMFRVHSGGSETKGGNKDKETGR